MTNPLCEDPDCKIGFGCAHRGPKGEVCDFQVEQWLAGLLGEHWHQGMTRKDLMKRVEQRMGALPPEELAGRLAERMQPERSAVTALFEDKE